MVVYVDGLERCTAALRCAQAGAAVAAAALARTVRKKVPRTLVVALNEGGALAVTPCTIAEDAANSSSAAATPHRCPILDFWTARRAASDSGACRCGCGLTLAAPRRSASRPPGPASAPAGFAARASRALATAHHDALPARGGRSRPRPHAPPCPDSCFFDGVDLKLECPPQSARRGQLGAKRQHAR